jgi:hypothetical protein
MHSQTVFTSRQHDRSACCLSQCQLCSAWALLAACDARERGRLLQAQPPLQVAACEAFSLARCECKALTACLAWLGAGRTAPAHPAPARPWSVAQPPSAACLAQAPAPIGGGLWSSWQHAADWPGPGAGDQGCVHGGLRPGCSTGAAGYPPTGWASQLPHNPPRTGRPAPPPPLLTASDQGGHCLRPS